MFVVRRRSDFYLGGTCFGVHIYVESINNVGASVCAAVVTEIFVREIMAYVCCVSYAIMPACAIVSLYYDKIMESLWQESLDGPHPPYINPHFQPRATAKGPLFHEYKEDTLMPMGLFHWTADKWMTQRRLTELCLEMVE
jgi:hypothetical protein